MLEVASSGVIKPDSWACIRGEGMPIQGRPFEKGNLYIHFTGGWGRARCGLAVPLRPCRGPAPLPRPCRTQGWPRLRHPWQDQHFESCAEASFPPHPALALQSSSRMR